MYPKKYLFITLASTIIITLIYRFYNKKKKDDDLKNDLDQKNLILKTDQVDQIILDDDQNIESYDDQNIESGDEDDELISEYSNDSIDSEYYPNWNNLLSELIKNGEKVFDTHICKIDKKNYVPVLDMRNHLNRFWIPK
jgi:hypothetical protein